MAPPHPSMSLPPSVGWSASAFVAAVLARLIRKGLELVVELDDAGTGHLRRLEGLLPSVWRVLDAADSGVVAGGRPLQDLLDAAYAADDALDDLDRALHGAAGEGDDGVDERQRSPSAARKPRSPLSFLLCFSPPRSSVASTSSSAHGKSSRAAKNSNNVNLNLDALRDALETMAQAAYRCTTAYEHVEPERNYATIVSGSRTEEGAGEEAEQDDIFGREAEVEAILEKVKASDDPHYLLGIGVLPVAGDAGVGKTALVRFVFHHEVVRAEFPVRMWVHVSGELGLRKRRIVDQIINGVTGFDEHLQEVDDGRELLGMELDGNRFLLVLDGVTDIVETQWQYLIELLKPANRRSLIILTTQSQTVATAIGTMPTLTLGTLGFKDYLKMFKHFTFGSTDETEECTLLGDDCWEDVEEEEEQEPEELSPMDQIASELAKKMNRLPLPAQAIGRALRFRKDDEGHWRSVLEDKIWEGQDVGAGIPTALWLSYRHLDPRLKQCFAYCAVFPGDYVFRKEEVVQMWMAQGLIYSDQHATRLEDVGGEFFDELVERCFFQAVEKNGYVMHNSMQVLAREVATTRFFMLNDESGDVPQDVRHLTVTTNNMSKLKEDLSVQISPIPDHHFLHRLRTILFFADFSDSGDFEDVLAHILSTAKSTRVFGLSSANITYLPPEIAQLRCLRYLNLSGNRIIDLPETLCQLYHLQVLDVRGISPSLRPPNGISGLELLPRIQDTEPTTEEALAATSKEGRWTSRLTTLQVHQCHKLRSLSSGLLQQQHLLKSLETLSIKNCDNVISDIPDGFKDLTALRDISLYDCPKMLVDKFHTSVRTLEISECFVVRGAWVQDHPFLFSVWKLKITGCSHVSCSDQDNRIEPLDWLNSLINVYSLHLENTKILRLSMFDQLPSLEILDVNGCDAFFSDLYDFAWLERLQTMLIRNCKEMGGLPENLCTLPELEELCIENCPAIEVLPENGLPTTLKRLSISKCGSLLTHSVLPGTPLERSPSPPLPAPLIETTPKVSPPASLHAMRLLRDPLCFYLSVVSPDAVPLARRGRALHGHYPGVASQPGRDGLRS
ncbi:hypothetical protein QOZ80_3AG0227730 [Eleusine coracana subsp. coracana]|nr:hypothetical protein QOZ80_3AG0227730 [Eleusine coracana subsp. coracana]